MIALCIKQSPSKETLVVLDRFCSMNPVVVVEQQDQRGRNGERWTKEFYKEEIILVMDFRVALKPGSFLTE
jgi:hypothetical protein